MLTVIIRVRHLIGLGGKGVFDSSLHWLTYIELGSTCQINGGNGLTDQGTAACCVWSNAHQCCTARDSFMQIPNAA